MGIFDEGFTITPPGSPEGQDQDGGAEDFEEQEADLPEQEELDDYQDDQDDESEDFEEDENEDEPSDNGQENSNKGDLILGKFKLQDDLANAYLNLQREFTKSRQPQSQQPAQQTTAQQLGTPEQAALFKQQFEQNPLGVMQYLIDNAVAARTAPIHEQRQTDILTKNISEVAKEYKQLNSEEGMKQLFGKVAEIAEDLGNPNLAKNPTSRVLRMAAAEAFGDTKQAVYNKAKQEGRKEAEAARAAKKGLPAARTGAKAKVTNEQKLSPEDEIRAGIMAANGRGGRGLLG
jgi:hypothetical protein